MNADLNAGGSVVMPQKQIAELWHEIHKVCPVGDSLIESVRQMRIEIEWLREVNSHLKGLKE